MQIHKYVLRYSSYILFYDNTYYLPIINNDYGETQQMCLPSCCSEGRVEAVWGWASSNNDGTGGGV